MNSLILAYGLAWAAIAGYIAWLALQERRLSQRIENLRSLPESTEEMNQTRRAA